MCKYAYIIILYVYNIRTYILTSRVFSCGLGVAGSLSFPLSYLEWDQPTQMMNKSNRQVDESPSYKHKRKNMFICSYIIIPYTIVFI